MSHEWNVSDDYTSATRTEIDDTTGDEVRSNRWSRTEAEDVIMDSLVEAPESAEDLITERVTQLAGEAAADGDDVTYQACQAWLLMVPYMPVAL